MSITYTLFLFFSGLLGLIVGSFINVLTLRWPDDGRSLKIRQITSGRSHCPKCHQTLKWIDLIPVLSFIFLRRRCRYCHEKISWQYPVVEIIMGLVFSGVSYTVLNINFFRYYLFSDFRAHFWILAIILLWFFFSALLIALSIIDLKKYLLPDQLLFPGIGIALLADFGFHFLSRSLASGFPHGGLTFLGSYADSLVLLFSPIVSYVLGAVVLAGFLFLLYFFSHGRAMGFGDVKLAIFIGLILGLFGGILSFMISFIIGAIVSLFIIIFKRKRLNDAIPFGPFLTLGVFFVIFLGEAIVNFYFSLFKG